MKSQLSHDYHNSAKRKLRDFQRGKKDEISPLHSNTHKVPQLIPDLSHTQRLSGIKSKSTQQLSNISRSLQNMSMDPGRSSLSPASDHLGTYTRNMDINPYSLSAAVSSPVLTTVPSSTNSQAQQNALSVLAADKMELQTLLRSEQTRAGEFQEELLQLRLDREQQDSQLREALERRADADANTNRLVASQRELTQTNNRQDQDLSRLREQFELSQQEKLEFQARLEASHHSLTSSQAECLSLSRQLEDAILVDRSYPVEGKSEKARKAAEEKVLAVNEENIMLRSQQGQLTSNLEKSIQEKERSDVQMHELKVRMEQNTEHARQQYSQLQEQCRLLQAETERRVREGEEHRKRGREKEQELQAVRAKLEAGRMVGEERRENSMDKVHDKLVSLERERVRLTELLENTRVNLSKTEQDLFESQEQLADQRSMTEALRQERKRSSELAQETKELGGHLERVEVEKYDLQLDINRLLAERDQLDQRLQQLQQASIQNQYTTPIGIKHSLSRSLSDSDIAISGEEKHILLGHRINSPTVPATESLQRAFDSLQTRFVQVMCQKAELEDRLQHKEKLLMLLEGETDTIGEYVSLYQSQRRALQIKYSQKQVLLDQLQVEKRSMQEDISRLRQLVQHLSQSKPIHGEIPDHTEISKVLEKYPLEHPDASLETLSAEETKQEIMQLLDRIDVIDPNVHGYHGIPMVCPCCTGSLLVV